MQMSISSQGTRSPNSVMPTHMMHGTQNSDMHGHMLYDSGSANMQYSNSQQDFTTIGSHESSSPPFLHDSSSTHDLPNLQRHPKSGSQMQKGSSQAPNNSRHSTWNHSLISRINKNATGPSIQNHMSNPIMYNGNQMPSNHRMTTAVSNGQMASNYGNGSNSSSSSKHTPKHHSHHSHHAASASATTQNQNGLQEDRRTRRPFKPSTVWDHFLRLSDGNVQCVHCAKVLKRKDSSTKTMWGHLRAIHYKGRDWTALQQAAAANRQSGGRKTPAVETNNYDATLDDVNLTGTAQSWLEEQLGISSSPSAEENQSFNGKDDKHELSEDNANSENSLKRPSSSSPETGTPTQPYVKRNRSVGYFCSTTPHDGYSSGSNSLSKLSSSSNGLSAVRAALAQQQRSTEENGEESNECSEAADIASAISSVLLNNHHHNSFSFNGDGSTFSLMDVKSVAMLMSVAADLDCTFSFHCRDGQPQFCLEPNFSAADKIRGPELVLFDLENEIRITERNDGMEVDCEMWKKTDWTQFTWAIRGKCQKALTKQ